MRGDGEQARRLEVSTHSRLKAAGTASDKASKGFEFQHTAA